MIKGVGTDLIKIARIERALEKHGDRFASRILTPDEMQLFKASPGGVRYLAKRFAVKEAIGDRVPGAVAWNLFDIDAKFGDVETVDTCVDYLNSVGK